MVKRFLLLFVMAVVATFSLYADELTVNDGTTTNSYLPIYGFYVDTQGAHSQFIQPASDLAVAEGGTITKLTFYSSYTKSFGGTQQFRLTEVAESDLSGGFAATTESNVVYAGGLTVDDGVMEVELTTPYTYNGGNLLVEWYCEVTTSYSSCQFFGVSATNAGRYATSATSSGSTQNFLPKMTIEYSAGGPVTCAKPASRATLTSVEARTAVLTWGAAEGATTYQYLVVASGEDADWTNAQMANGTSVTLNGLTPNTVYDFYVRTYCSAEDQSTAQKTTFRTECAAFALPWSEGFENETAEAMPSCWSTVAAGPKVYANGAYSTNSHSGNNCLYVYAGSTYYGEQYIVFPAMDFDLNTAQLRMWYKQSSTSGSYVAPEVGVMSDPSDGSTFVLLSTLEKQSEYTYFDCNLTTDAEHTYLAIHIPSTGYSTGYFFDDIALVQKPTCLRPEHIMVTDEDFTTAVLRWESDSELGDSVLVKNGDEVLYNVFVQGDSLLLENLTPASIYSLTVSVMGVCSDTDHSAVKTVTVNFQTACNVVASFPWLETFENGSNDSNFVQACWTNEHISGPGSYLFQYATGGEEGNALKLPDMNTTTYTLLTLPEFNIPADGKTYEFQLSVNRNGSGSTKQHEGVNVIYNNDQDTLFIPRYVGVKGSVGTVEATGWYTYSVQLSAGMNTIKILGVSEYGNATYMDNFRVGKPVTCFKGSNIHVVSDATTTSSATIAWDAPEQGAAQYKVTVKVGDSIYVDNALVADTFYVIENLTRYTAYSFNVSIVSVCGDDDESDPFTKTVSVTTLPTCYPVSGLTVDSVTVSSACMHWVASGHGETQYQAVALPYDAEQDWTNAVVVSDTTVVIEGLESNTKYKVYVRSYCGDDDQSTAVSAAFYTAAAFPFTETFDGGKPGNWMYSNTSRTNVFNGTAMASTGMGWTIQSSETQFPAGFNKNLKLNIYGTNCNYWAVVPTMDVPADARNPRLTFDMAWTSYNSSNAPSASSTDDLFLVAISTDGGKTWSAENAYIWANDSAVLTMGLLDSISNVATPVSIDLSAFAGQSVTIGFYGESTVSGGDNDIHIDNVTIAGDYVVSFVNYDGTVLENDTLAGFEVPEYAGEEPIKPATAQYTYTFTGWDKELAPVKADVVYTAQYDSVVNVYEITFVNFDGVELEKDTVAYGEVPAYLGATPEKAATAQYTYTFSGWTPALAAVTGAATYTAQYDSVVNTYVVTFKDWDATVLKADTVAYGAAATAPADPVREGYVFTGWDADFSNVVADLTVTAQYQSTVGFENTNAVDATKAVKFFKDGQIYIRRGEELFDATGRKVE